MKKIAKLLIIALLISLVATACQPEEPEEVFDLDLVGTANLNDLGGTKIIYEFGISENATAQCLGYELDTMFGDLASKRLKDVKTELNCDLEIHYEAKSPQRDRFVACTSAGQFMCDVIIGISDWWTDLARIGMVIGLSQLEDYIDFRNEAKWGYRNMLEVVYWDDDLYGLIPLLWPEVSVTYSVPLVVNEDLISALGETDPRDYIENGQWTWDTFEECLPRYYVQEGGDVKHYALTTDAGTFACMFVFSDGAQYVEKDLSGKYVSGFYSDQARKAMERGIEIFFGPYSDTISKTSGDATQALISARTVLGTVRSEYIIGIDARIAKEMTNFGILSWPVGPDVDPHYLFSHYGNMENCITFSSLSDYPEAAATVINKLYEPFEEYPTFESIKELMTKNYFYDKRDTDIYYGMFFNSIFNYFHYSGTDIMSKWLSPSKSVSEFLESSENKVNEIVENYCVHEKNGIDAIWSGEESN